jgi:hypothetical protein
MFVGVWQGVAGALICGGVCWSVAGCGGCINMWWCLLEYGRVWRVCGSVVRCTKMWQGTVQ